MVICQKFSDCPVNILKNVSSGKIQDQLVAAHHRKTAWHFQCPVRVRPVQLRILIDHLRLDPDSELHPHRVDRFDDSGQSGRKFVGIHRPVSQTAIVVVSFPEPPVVKNKKIDPDSGRFPREPEYAFFAHVEIRGLPAVQKDRTNRLRPLSSLNVFPDRLMKMMRQLCEPLVRK